MKPLSPIRHCALLFACVVLGQIASQVRAQTAPSTNAAALGPLKEGWEDIDQRFMFLTVELSSAEASINSIDKALVLAGYQKHISQEKSEGYAAGNSLMDRRGGGPVGWQDFYGKTAMNFYYHASETIDVKDPPFVGHEEWNGKTLTKVDRPPQFDFIYRANADAKAHADAETAALGTRIDQLLARRRQLEAEQSALWFKIALRGLSTRSLSDKPLYRFEPKGGQLDDLGKQRLAAVAAACKFMRTINKLASEAQPALDHDQSYAYSQLRQEVAAACEELRTVLLAQPLLYEELDDSQSNLGRLSRAAHHLEDSSQNLSDAYRLAGDGDRSGDDQRKDGFRAQLQESTIDFTQTVITADRLFTLIVRSWKISPDISHPIAADVRVLIAPTTAPSVIGPQASLSELTVPAQGAKSAAQPDSADSGTVLATSVVCVADDFVVDVFHNGQKIPDSRIHLDMEYYGATAFRIDVKLHHHDWLVFNVANDRFRWGGNCGFSAAGLRGDKVPVFETHEGRGSWSACDAPEQSSQFIKEAEFMSDRPTAIPAHPWSACNDQMKARCAWDGDTVWAPSEVRNVWIKYVVP